MVGHADDEFDPLGPVDETLPKDGGDGSDEDRDALEAELPEDPSLREEVLRQRLAHALLIEESRLRAAAAAAPDGEVKSSLDPLLAQLPPRPQPHPGAWRVLRGPMFLVAMMFFGVLIVNANRKPMDAAPLIEKVLAQLPTDALRDYRGLVALSSADGTTTLEGQLYWRTDGCFRFVPSAGELEHAGSDGSRVWFGPPTAEVPRVFTEIRRARSIVPDAFRERGLTQPMAFELSGRLRAELASLRGRTNDDGEPLVRVEKFPGDAGRKYLVTSSLRIGIELRSGQIESIAFEDSGSQIFITENSPVELQAAVFDDPSVVPGD